MRLNYLSIPAILFFLVGDSKAQSNSSVLFGQAKKAIEESNAIYFQAFVTGDSTIFIERYSTDCCIMPPNRPAMCGKNAALDFFKLAYYQMGLRNGKLITTAVYGDGAAFVTEEGLFQLFDANGKMFNEGKFLVLWKKNDRGWKMFRDSFSSNHPQPQQ